MKNIILRCLADFLLVGWNMGLGVILGVLFMRSKSRRMAEEAFKDGQERGAESESEFYRPKSDPED